MENPKEKSSIFRFKQFSVDDSKCAMKVGTDGVLIACILPKYQRGRFLDIGSGSGVISLILAQNNPNAKITAVEIDASAHIQSLQNFENSNWSDRILAVNETIQEFSKNTLEVYDYIICNPPFFKANDDLSGFRKTARQDIKLSFHDLTEVVGKLLSDKGKFYCIVPTDRSAEMISWAKENEVLLQSKILVKGKVNLKAKRSILVFSKNTSEMLLQEEIIIYNEDNSYTEQYKNITKEFYLKF